MAEKLINIEPSVWTYIPEFNVRVCHNLGEVHNVSIIEYSGVTRLRLNRFPKEDIQWFIAAGETDG